MNYPVDYVTASRQKNYDFDFSNTTSVTQILDNSRRNRLLTNLGKNPTGNKKPKFLSHQINSLSLNANRLTRKLNSNYASNSSIVNFKFLGGNADTKQKPAVSKPFMKNLSSYIDYINNFSSENVETFASSTSPCQDGEVPDVNRYSLDHNNLFASPTEFHPSPVTSIASEEEKSRYRLFNGKEFSQNFVDWDWDRKRQPKEKLFLPLITLPQGQDFSVSDFI